MVTEGSSYKFCSQTYFFIFYSIKGKLIEEEQTGGSVVQLSTYAGYIHYMGGWGMALLMLLLAGVTVFCLVTTNACVAIWLRASLAAMVRGKKNYS